MSRAPKCREACALRAVSSAPKPIPNSTVPTVITHIDGARASAARASAISRVAPAISGPAGTRKRPVTALETTEAAMPGTSRIPSAPTGWPRLSRIEGHSRPRVEPGRATPTYARQARRKAGTEGTPGMRDGRIAVPRIRAARDDGLIPRVSACGVARAPQLLEGLFLP